MLRLDLATIYFHTDYDGVVSAAILARLGSARAALHGVDYDLKARWSTVRIEPASAVVDFLYHPDAAVWFDHHSTPFVSSEWEARYHPDAHHHWDPDAAACPPVIAACLGLSPNDRRHFADYIRWSEIIDGARYESAAQAHDLSNPHILLSRVVDLARESDVLAEVVRLVAAEAVDAVLGADGVRPLADASREAEHELRRRLSPHISYNGRVAFFDQSDVPGTYQRYLPYLFHPEADYVIGIYRKGDQFNISVGANPWKTDPRPHLGLLCQKWGGGGHPKVGGITVIQRADALRIASEVRAELVRVG
jgi:hypothetical protein